MCLGGGVWKEEKETRKASVSMRASHSTQRSEGRPTERPVGAKLDRDKRSERQGGAKENEAIGNQHIEHGVLSLLAQTLALGEQLPDVHNGEAEQEEDHELSTARGEERSDVRVRAKSREFHSLRFGLSLRFARNETCNLRERQSVRRVCRATQARQQQRSRRQTFPQPAYQEL